MKAKSKIVGEANRNRVFEALKPLVCGFEEHGAIINTGELFTRGSPGRHGGYGSQRVPVCGKCYPFGVIRYKGETENEAMVRLAKIPTKELLEIYKFTRSYINKIKGSDVNGSG